MAINPTKNNFSIDFIEQELQKIPHLKSIDDPLFADGIQKAFIIWTKDVTSQMKQWIVSDVGRTTNLSQSIRNGTPVTNGKIILTDISAPYYWTYFNYGVDPLEGSGKATINEDGFKYKFKLPFVTKSHAEAIANWLPSTGRFGGLENYSSVFYGIAMNNKKRGLKARPFVQSIMTQETIDFFGKKLFEITGKHFEVVWNEEAEEQEKSTKNK